MELHEPFTSDGLDLQGGFASTLPEAMQKRIDAIVENACEAGWRCAYAATDDAIAKLGLEAKWASEEP